jgi:hypothetical protein
LRRKFPNRKKPGYPLQSFLPLRGKKGFPLLSLARAPAAKKKKSPLSFLTYQSSKNQWSKKSKKEEIGPSQSPLLLFMFSYSIYPA